MMTPRQLDALKTAAIGLLLLISALLFGCESKFPESQYGQVIYDIPKINGADKPYPLPQLEDAEEKPEQVEK